MPSSYAHPVTVLHPLKTGGPASLAQAATRPSRARAHLRAPAALSPVQASGDSVVDAGQSTIVSARHRKQLMIYPSRVLTYLLTAVMQRLTPALAMPGEAIVKEGEVC